MSDPKMTIGSITIGESDGNIQIGDHNIAEVTSVAKTEFDAANVDPVEEPDLRSAPIFISHCHADNHIVEKVIDLLTGGLNLNSDDIIALGHPGSTIPQGALWLDSLRERLQDTELIVSVVTPAYLTSYWCMIELGALWVQKKANIPLLVEPVQMDQVNHLLGSMQLSYLHDVNALNRLRDRVVDSKQLTSDTSRWERRRDDFLAALSTEPPAPPVRVEREELDRALVELEKAKGELAALG